MESQAVFQAETQAKTFPIESTPRASHEGRKEHERGFLLVQKPQQANALAAFPSFFFHPKLNLRRHRRLFHVNKEGTFHAIRKSS